MHGSFDMLKCEIIPFNNKAPPPLPIRTRVADDINIVTLKKKKKPIISPLEHYKTDWGGEWSVCGCKYCEEVDYYRKLANIRELIFRAGACKCDYCQTRVAKEIKFDKKGNVKSDGENHQCKFFLRAHAKFLAASNRQSLWNSMSFQTTIIHKEGLNPTEMMEWLDKEIDARRVKSKKLKWAGDGWWALWVERPPISVRWWLDLFCQAVYEREKAKLSEIDPKVKTIKL